MKKLPLYPTLPLPPVQKIPGLDRDEHCTRCSFSSGTPTGQRCLSAEGTPGDILVVGEHPTEVERRLGRPMASAFGRWFRDVLSRLAPEAKVVWTNAIGCMPPANTSDSDEAIEACRPYLARVFEESRPRLVLLLGPEAALGFLGRSYQPLSVRTGYGWCFVDDIPVPVFMLPRPAEASRNRLMAKAIYEDLKKIIDGKVELNVGALYDSYEIIENAEDAEKAWECLNAAPYVATDVETSGMMFESDFRIECLAVSAGTRTFVFSREAIENITIRPWLDKILSELDHTSWNGQYDYCAIENEPLLGAFPVQRPENHPGGVLNLQSDARIKRKMRDSDAKASLEIAAELVGMGGHKEENHEIVEKICIELRKLSLATELTPSGKVRKPPVLEHVTEAEIHPAWLTYLKQGFAPEKFAHRFVPKDIEHRYVALDACSTWHLETWVNKELSDWHDEGLLVVWEEVSKPAMWAWCRARMNGFPTDKQATAILSEYLKTEAELVLKQIHGFKPGLNPASGKQVGEYLSSLGLKSSRKTDSNKDSWSKEVLTELEGKHPVVKLLLRHRLLTDVNGDQVEGLLPFIRSDGRVHASFLLDGTATGRPSSQEPNFFNRLKGRDEHSRELGNMLRSCHAAPLGWTIIEADEGQIEIRKAADLSRDPAMIAMLNSGIDFHTQSAERFAPVMGKDFAAMSKEEKDIFRETCKTTNFAAIYEIPSELGFMLSMRLKVDKKVGDALGDAMFRTYTGLRSFMEGEYAHGWETGRSRTFWKGGPGRSRPLWGMGVNPATLKQLEDALASEKRNKSREGSSKFNKTDARATYNGAVQGSSVDIITSMLWKVIKWMDANTNGGQFLLQIYDSIMLLVRDEDVQKTLDYLIPLMKDELSQKEGYMNGVPLSVDVKFGKDWAGLQKVKQEKKA